MERPAMLLETILKQFSVDLDLSVERDVTTMWRRYEHEGFSFLALTLPRLSDALLQGIESGRFTCPTDFCRHGSLPRFLGGFFKRVFTMDGGLRDNACPDSIFAIRSVCDFWKKPQIACSPERNAKAEAKYIAVEGELAKLTPAIKRKDLILDSIAGILWSQVFSELDPLDIVCKHGPGNTADRRLSNDRNQFSWWYSRAEPWFPSALHCYPNYGYAAEAIGQTTSTGVRKSLDYLDEWSEPPVRVVFVPKTLKTPRVIALEPSPMQFIQQGLMNHIVPILESHRLTRNSIRFSDQGVNQQLAHKASLDRTLTTLDLSDASDRVHVDLVYRIFKSSGIRDYLLAARSAQANLPSGKLVTLHKFASMGSAICFPVEAMVFYTLVQSAMHKHDGKRPSSTSIRDYSQSVAVYGDDIIVPVDYTDAVVHELEAYGLKVNANKSFRNSLFRESCGADYYNGEPVRPVYAREMAPSDARSWTANQVLSWVATANQFYLNGMWLVAQEIREMLESVLRYPIPRSRDSRGDGVYFASVMFDTNLRYNKGVHGYSQKRTVFIPLQKEDDIDGNAIACLNRWGQQLNTPDRVDEFVTRSLAWDFRSRVGLSDLLNYGDSCVAGLPNIRSVQASVAPLRDNTVRPRRVYQAVRQAVELILAVYSKVQLSRRCYLQNSTDAGTVTRRVASRVVRPKSGIDLVRDLLLARSTGMNFQTSVKRGDFKSKRRWVTTVS